MAIREALDMVHDWLSMIFFLRMRDYLKLLSNLSKLLSNLVQLLIFSFKRTFFSSFLNFEKSN